MNELFLSSEKITILDWSLKIEFVLLDLRGGKWVGEQIDVVLNSYQ